MTLKIIGIFLMLPAIAFSIAIISENKELRTQVINTLAILGFIVGLLMLIFG